MNYQVIASFLACIVLVSANYYDDDDDNGIEACYNGLHSCLLPVRKYQSSDPLEIAEVIKRAGIEPVCHDITQSLSCTKEVIRRTDCPPEIDQMFNKVDGVFNLICVDKIEDIAHHWDCLFGAHLDPTLDECQRFNERLASCQTEDIIRCVDKAAKASPLCKPGATQLVADILNKMISIIPHCSERNLLQSMLLNYLKK